MNIRAFAITITATSIGVPYASPATEYRSHLEAARWALQAAPGTTHAITQEERTDFAVAWTRAEAGL